MQSKTTDKPIRLLFPIPVSWFDGVPRKMPESAVRFFQDSQEVIKEYHRRVEGKMCREGSVVYLVLHVPAGGPLFTNSEEFFQMRAQASFD